MYGALLSKSFLFLSSLILLAACNSNWESVDQDGDDYSVQDGDCWDIPEGPPGSGLTGADIHPGAAEIWYDGFDQDCLGDSDYDADGDGFVPDEYADEGAQVVFGVAELEILPGGDCWDDPASTALEHTVVSGQDALGNELSWSQPTADQVYPGAPGEVWYDGIDSDCDGDDFDQDEDGYQSDDYPHWDTSGNAVFGDDCMDDPNASEGLDHLNYAGLAASEVNPSAGEVWYDGTDADCDDNDCDADGDGYSYAGSQYCEANDCDDTDPEKYPDPSIEEIWYNGEDENCDGNDGDQDGDGYYVQGYEYGVPTGFLPDDCDDEVEAVNPGASEVWYDGTDDDCDGNDGDQDGDDYYVEGYEYEVPADYLPGDCDDASGEVHPGATEYCDGIDNNCVDGVDEDTAADASTWYADTDGDGYGNASVSRNACTQPTGYVGNTTDCDDDNSAANPSMIEYCSTDFDDDCDGDINEDDAADVSTWYADVDADGYGNLSSTDIDCEQPTGYVADATDCDDDNPLASPAMAELCLTDFDDDCDGDINEDDADDVSTWYQDADGDGFADPYSTDQECEQPSGYLPLEDATDCDDGDAAINPAATEVCDEADNDCDGTVDEDDAADAPIWYQDADADGFGNASVSQSACDQPTGYVSDATDCVDDSADINPDATEVCNDLDDDCDGDMDDDDPTLDLSSASTWYPDADGDGWGASSPATQACDQPSGQVATSTDCDDGDEFTFPGAAETESSTACMTDADADGYGSESPASGVTAGTDCNDSGYWVNPGRAEIWYNGTDNDCDGLSDYDADYDGHESDDYGGDDCDDLDAGVNPSVASDDNSDPLVDNDCDQYVDEDAISTGSLVITEISQNSTAPNTAWTKNNDANWVEVYNTESFTIDLSNWVLLGCEEDNDTHGFNGGAVDWSYCNTIYEVAISPEAELQVPAYGRAVICVDSSVFDSASDCDYAVASDAYSGSGPSGDTYSISGLAWVAKNGIAALELEGTTIDQVGWYDQTYYGGEAWPNAIATTLCLMSSHLDASSNDSLANWATTSKDSSNAWYTVGSPKNYGTPGAADSSCK